MQRQCHYPIFSRPRSPEEGLKRNCLRRLSGVAETWTSPTPLGDMHTVSSARAALLVQASSNVPSQHLG